MSRSAKPKAKGATAYIVVRELGGEVTSYTEPDRAFADRKAAAKYADELNAQLRALTNPFGDYGNPDGNVKGGEKAFLALVKKLGLPVPAKQKGYGFIDWERWWDDHYADMTDAQRAAVWDAMEKYNWYKVQATSVE